MKTIKELHDEAVSLLGKDYVFKALRKFYNDLIRTPGIVKIIISDLNVRTGAKFRPTATATKKHIVARIREGATVADFLAVNEVMTTKWRGTEMQPYLRPATLYNSEKFEGYLAEYERWKIETENKKKLKRQKELAEKAKLGEAVRTELKPWYSFPSYQSLWSYVAQLNKREFGLYEMPRFFREMQPKWLAIKFSKDKSKMQQIEDYYQKTKRNGN